MAQAYVGTATDVAVVSASGTITLTKPAIAIVAIVFLNGGATSIVGETGSVGTATSTVTNAFAFTGTAESPSTTLTANSGLGTDSVVIVEYVPAGAVKADL